MGLPNHGLLGLGIADATLGSNGEKLLLLERGDDLLHLGGLDAATELKHRLDGPNHALPLFRAQLLQSLRHIGRPLGMIHSWGDLRIARHLRRRRRASGLELLQRILFLRRHLNDHAARCGGSDLLHFLGRSNAGTIAARASIKRRECIQITTDIRVDSAATADWLHPFVRLCCYGFRSHWMRYVDC